MIFSDFYRSPRSPLSKLRHHHNQGSAHLPTATPDWVAAEYADLLSKDKAKQKEAVKRYLSDKVRSDWEFHWPPQPQGTVTPGKAGQTVQGPGPGEDEAQYARLQVQDETRDDDGYQVDEGSELEQPPSEEDEMDDQEDDAESVYSVVSEDHVHYRPRVESTSDVSEDETSAPSSLGPLNSIEAMRLVTQKRSLDRRARHRRNLRDEMACNDGLACFEARRNAWTGAKTVRVRSKPPTPALASPRSPRRFFFRHSMSGSPPTSIPSTMAQAADAAGAVSDASSLAKDNDKELKTLKTQDSEVSDSPPPPESYPVETLVPVGQPLLPPNNSLRASITPAVYVSLYDKVVINNLQPACPVNLSDMLRSCIAGWKRDGEWPPRAAVVDSTLAVRMHKKAAATGSEHGGNVARRMSLGLLGREKDDDYRTGKGIRRSLQRALGIGLAPGSPDGGDGEKTKGV
ncbi:hypothetical protein G6O67_004715 [Ophiocordyceps sinensis]|uniref:Gag1-like clamp domain-containing protein n=1 Tax=Ophiocordyceps sinensis TaxID=72228 RepID=A0A8H4PQ12_9HYPO|nr:hypothetical protein G6O67_004715 [Ophiocordyceps sinensis]